MSKTIRLHASSSPMPRLINKRPSFWFRQGMARHGKPVGLWYAIGDEWLQCCAAEGWLEDYDYKHFYEIDVSEANVLRLSTAQEVLDFHDTYRGDPHFVPGFEIEPGDWAVDWEAVRKRYDGIEIFPYQQKLRFDLHWYYTWDVACGCVWRMGKVSSREVSSEYHKGKESNPCPLSKNSG